MQKHMMFLEATDNTAISTSNLRAEKGDLVK